MSGFGGSFRGDNESKIPNQIEINLENNSTTRTMQQPTRKGSQTKLRFDVWKCYHIKELGGGFRRTTRKYCGHVYAQVSRNIGTKNLKQNLKGCARKNS